MSQLIVDEVMLREPNLLVPGKKPVGMVKIDWSHPLTRGLRTAILYDGLSLSPHFIYDDIGGFAWENGGILSGADTHGKYQTSAGINRFISTKTFSNIGLVDGVTCLSVVSFKITSVDIGLFGSTSTVPQVFLDTSGGNLRLALYTGTASVYSSVEYSSAQYLQCAYSINAITDIGNSYVNGKQTHDDVGIGTSAMAGAIEFAGASTKSGLLNNSNSQVYSSFLWKGILSNSELQSLSLDPYQFLIPA